MSDAVDHELPPLKRHEMNQHMELCAPCSRTFMDFARIKEAVRDQPAPVLPAWVAARIRAETTERISWWNRELASDRWLAALLGSAVAAGACFFMHAAHTAKQLEARYVTVARFHPVRSNRNKPPEHVALRRRGDVPAGDSR